LLLSCKKQEEGGQKKKSGRQLLRSGPHCCDGSLHVLRRHGGGALARHLRRTRWSHDSRGHAKLAWPPLRSSDPPSCFAWLGANPAPPPRAAHIYRLRHAIRASRRVASIHHHQPLRLRHRQAGRQASSPSRPLSLPNAVPPPRPTPAGRVRVRRLFRRSQARTAAPFPSRPVHSFVRSRGLRRSSGFASASLSFVRRTRGRSTVRRWSRQSRCS
jgi:hypothetical protein